MTDKPRHNYDDPSESLPIDYRIERARAKARRRRGQPEPPPRPAEKKPAEKKPAEKKPKETLMRIEVTAGDIEKGQRGNCHQCPVALALYRAYDIAYPFGGEVGIGMACIRVQRKGKSRREYQVPLRVAAFEDAFDHGQAVQPFSFNLPDRAPAD